MCFCEISKTNEVNHNSSEQDVCNKEQDGGLDCRLDFSSCFSWRLMQKESVTLNTLTYAELEAHLKGLETKFFNDLTQVNLD